jgi:hypothetical protein
MMGKGWKKRNRIEERAKKLESMIIENRKNYGTQKVLPAPTYTEDSNKVAVKVVKDASKKKSWEHETNVKISIAAVPKLIMPFEIWRDHLVMSQFAKGEYTTAMKVSQSKESPNEYRVTDYFVPQQKCTGASAEWTKEGIIELVKHTEGVIEDWYGVFHIHPWAGKSVSMSGTDTNTMWKWVGASKRGIFLVSNPDGARDLWLVIEANGVKMQIPMDFEIDYAVSYDKTEELKKLLEAKVSEPVYAAPLYRAAPQQGFGHGYYDYWDRYDEEFGIGVIPVSAGKVAESEEYLKSVEQWDEFHE